MDGHAEAFGISAAWGSAELRYHHFMAHWSGRGWHLDRDLLDSTLRERARDAGVEVIDERVTAIARDNGRWRVNGKRTSEWIVDGSGRSGSVVGRLGVPRVRLDNQIALVGVVPDVGGERITTVESTVDGWWYSTPLPNGQRVLARVTDADLVGSDRTRNWQRSLSETTYMRAFAKSRDLLTIGAYPSGTEYREQLYGDGWLAVGDSAASFDPLSSQGLISGVVMAAHAARLMGGELAPWERAYRAVLDEHEALRAHVYASETRWPDSSFWARRSGVRYSQVHGC